MAKFRVYGIVSGTKYLGEFDAKDKEAAIKMAEPDAQICLCHQCSDEAEDAEIHEIIAEEVK